MRLLELRLLNFRQHADTRICFPAGLTGVVGPNGAGKSTLLEAIGWVIYGSDATRGTRETLRHGRAEPDAPVEAELRFVLGDHEYRVVRSLAGAEAYVDGGSSPAAASDEGVSEFLRRRLGMSRREFFNTYFTGQKELQFLAAMGPTERGRFLSTVLGYDRLRVAQGLARERRNALRTRVEVLRAGVPDEDRVRSTRRESVAAVREAREVALRAARRLEEARGHAASARPRWEGAREARDRYASLHADLSAAEGEIPGAEREIRTASDELQRIAAAEAELERVAGELARLPEVEGEQDRLEHLSRVEERRRTLAEQARELEAELARSADRLARLEQAPELLQRYAAELESATGERDQLQAELDQRKTAWLRDRQDAETKLQSYRDRAVELQEEIKRIRSAGPEGSCPTCRRPLGDDFERLLGSLEEQWAEVTQDGKWWRSRHDQLAERPSEIVDLEDRLRLLNERMSDSGRKHARCEAALQELDELRQERSAREARIAALRKEIHTLPSGYDAERHRGVVAELASLRRMSRRAAALQETVRRKGEWEDALRSAEARRRAAQARADAARARIAELAVTEAELRTLRDVAEEAERALREAELEQAAAQERLRNAEAAAAEAVRAERALERRLAELDEQLSELRHHHELDSAFTRLRADLNARVRPELSEIASKLISQLTDGRYGTLEIDDAYRILVVENGLPKPVISGGEEDIANLVMRIALSQMIAERAGHRLSLLVLDEVFGSLDAIRRENVVRLLRRLGARFEQVLLVTHLEEIRGAMDQVLRVELDEARGSSVVSWEPRGA